MSSSPDRPAPVSETTPAPLGPGTLGRKLVLRVVALVAVAALLLGAAAALATRQLLINSIDNQLDYSSGRIRNASGGPGGGDPRGGLLQPGQVIGTFVAVYDSSSGEVLTSSVQQENRRQTSLDSSALDELRNLNVSGRPTSVSLSGIGHYRVVSFTATVQNQLTGETANAVIITGVPLAKTDQTLFALVITLGLLSVLAIGGAAFGARALVIRSLRPLNRVAGIAQQVSQLPLDRGEVALAVRVPPADADPTSEVGRVGQALNHMLTNVDGALAARQASEMKVRQFVADASHELRNPLAAIRGYAELTRRGRDQLAPDAAYAMSRVESEAARMSRLVEDLLLLARLDSGPNLEITDVDLTELVIDALSDARAAGPDHRWSLALPDEPVLARGDRHRMHQVLVNLLANARTHTPAGTHVEVGLGVVDAWAELSVTDDGPGIPPEVQGTVFERFTRADSSRARSLDGAQVTSTGLGLAIVAAVVEAHQGSVAVQSRPGQTCFRVRLPLVGVAPSASAELTTAP